MSERNRTGSHLTYPHNQYGHMQQQQIMHPVSGPSGAFHMMTGSQQIPNNMAAMSSSWGTPQPQGNHLMSSHLTQGGGMINQMMPQSVYPFQYPHQQPFYAPSGQPRMSSIGSMGVVQPHQQHSQLQPNMDSMYSSGYYPQQFPVPISIPNEILSINPQIISGTDGRPIKDLKTKPTAASAKIKKGRKKKTDETTVPKEKVRGSRVTEPSQKERSNSESSRQRKKSVQLSDAALENRK